MSCRVVCTAAEHINQDALQARNVDPVGGYKTDHAIARD